jgi:hypothetical protein
LVVFDTFWGVQQSVLDGYKPMDPMIWLLQKLYSLGRVSLMAYC